MSDARWKTAAMGAGFLSMTNVMVLTRQPVHFPSIELYLKGNDGGVIGTGRGLDMHEKRAVRDRLAGEECRLQVRPGIAVIGMCRGLQCQQYQGA